MRRVLRRGLSPLPESCENRPLCYSFPMSQDHLIKLKSTKSDHVYFTTKNRKQVERKLEFLKFDPTLRKRVAYKEAKK